MNRAKLSRLLILHEGMRLRVYDDANGREILAGDTVIGHPTIGIGRNVAGDGLGISEDEAKYLLMGDIARLEKEIKGWKFMEDLNEPRQAVVYDMLFNMGINRFNGDKWKNMFKAMYDQQWQVAAEEMLASRWAKQVGQRSVRLSQMMRLGEWYVD